MVLIVSSKIH